MTPHRIIASSLRAGRAVEVQLLDLPLALAGGRLWVLAARRGRVGPPVVQGCVASDSTPRMRLTCLTLPTPGLDDVTSLVGGDHSIVDDYDDDGRPEVRILLEWEVTPPGFSGPGDETRFSRLTVVDLGMPPRLAASIEVGAEGPRRARQTGQVDHADVNGDGHGDIVIDGEYLSLRRPAARAR